MSEVRTHIDIAAPIDRVWAVAIDPKRFPDWVTIHRAFGHVDAGSARPGFRMDQTLTLRGAPFKVAWTLTDCDPPRRALWHGRGPAGSHAQTEYLLAERDGGTRLTYRNEFEPPLGVLGRLAQRAIAGTIPETEAKKSLLQLKSICESLKD